MWGERRSKRARNDINSSSLNILYPAKTCNLSGLHSSGPLCDVVSSSTQSSSSQVMPRRPGTLRVAPAR